MPFLIYLIIMIVMLVIADLTRPVPKAPKRPGLSDFEFPTADASRKIPVIWGKPLLRGPNVTWYGDLRISKIVKKVKGVFSDKKYTAGYKYNIGLHMAFCCGDGDVKLLKILIGKDVAWSNAAGVGAGRYRINNEGLWGGEEQEGGVSGSFDWCPGGQGQGQNSYLVQRLGARVPAYRSSARLVWRGGYLGTSKYIKEWAAQCQRLPNALGTGYHNIDGEANPAEMLYEIITNKHWGLGATAVDVEMSTFTRAAKTLYDEKFGLSIIWDGAKTLRAIADDVLAHIDGYMFVNIQTGRWELGLSRQPTEAEVAGLMTLDQNDIQELESYSRPSLDETTNEVNVIWTQDGETTRWPAKAQHLGLFQVHDKQFISVDTTYQGITSYELAARVATRDLNTLSYPLVKFSGKCSRKAAPLKPGSRFKFDWEPLEIKGMVMVVLGIGYGTLDDNEISIDAVQDVFSLGSALYSNGGNSGWVRPDRQPRPATAYRMEFTPRWLMSIDDEIAAADSAVPLLLVEAPSSMHLGYDLLYSDPSLNGTLAAAPDSQAFTPTGVLAHDYLETAAMDSSGTLIIRNLTGLGEPENYTAQEIQYLGQGLIIIGSEWLGLANVEVRADGSVSASRVYRGLVDSVPARHLAGTKVWFVSLGAGRTPTELFPFRAGTYTAKIISRALGGVLDESLAPTLSISTDAMSSNARPLYAYPPRDLALNGSRAPGALANGPLTVTWKHANRLTEQYLHLQDEASSSLEAGATYTVQLFNDTGQLLSQATGLTTQSHVFNLPSGLPESGYVQVRSPKAALNGGHGSVATLWFGRQVNYAAVADSAPQLFLEDSAPWQFLRMSD